MHPIPEGRKSPSFRAAVGAGLAVLVAAGIVFLGPDRALESSSSGTSKQPGTLHSPVALRLEPAPPPDPVFQALRGRPVLVFRCGLPVAFADFLPALNRHQREYDRKQLEVLGLHLGPRTPELEALLDNYSVGWRFFHDAPGSALSEWKARFPGTSLPWAILMDGEGKRVYSGGMWGLASALEKALGPPASVPRAIIGEVKGRLMHAGRPASDFTEQAAQFGPFRDEATGRFAEKDFHVKYDPRTGEFRVLGIPEGRWGVYITCGPFWHNFRTFIAAGRVPPEAVLDLMQRIYLRNPVDTSRDVPGRANSFHPSPVAFEWDAIPGAADYAVAVRRRRLDVPESEWQAISLAPVTEPRISLDVETGFQYEFGVQARGPSGILAGLRIYQDGLGSQYVFQAGEPRVEKEGK